MLEQLAEAIKNEDYSAAKQLLRDLQEEDPTNPWIGFYLARLTEANGNIEEAQQAYLTVLRTSTHPKIIAQARQGINRLTQQEQTLQQEAHRQREVAIQAAMTNPGNEEMGVLVLEAIPSELKQEAAQKFAKIMEIDAYSARLQLPSRSWRLYRTGAMGLLEVYKETLKGAEIPCFCASIEKINKIIVYPVFFLESLEPQVTVVYEPHKGQRDIFSFPWSAVSQRVEGMVPIFEECMERGLRGKMERKIKILDYAKFYDLHLPKEKVILRFCDQTYQFNQGYGLIPASTEGQSTQRDAWLYLKQLLEEKLSDIPIWSDFTPFAETALDFTEMLKQITSHINLLRREDSLWDQAFALYSGLAFLKENPPSKPDNH